MITPAQEHSDVSSFEAWAAFELCDEISRRAAALERIAADRPAPTPLALSIADTTRDGIGAALNELAERCGRCP